MHRRCSRAFKYVWYRAYISLNLRSVFIIKSKIQTTRKRFELRKIWTRNARENCTHWQLVTESSDVSVVVYRAWHANLHNILN